MALPRILIVEDESITSYHLQTSLVRLGYDARWVVTSGEDAVAKAEQIRPDLVLMDIMLNGPIDGIEAAERIRSRFRIPTVFLTAYRTTVSCHAPSWPNHSVIFSSPFGRTSSAPPSRWPSTSMRWKNGCEKARNATGRLLNPKRKWCAVICLTAPSPSPMRHTAQFSRKIASRDPRALVHPNPSGGRPARTGKASSVIHGRQTRAVPRTPDRPAQRGDPLAAVDEPGHIRRPRKNTGVPRRGPGRLGQEESRRRPACKQSWFQQHRGKEP